MRFGMCRTPTAACSANDIQSFVSVGDVVSNCAGAADGGKTALGCTLACTGSPPKGVPAGATSENDEGGPTSNSLLKLSYAAVATGVCELAVRSTMCHGEAL